MEIDERKLRVNFNDDASSVSEFSVVSVSQQSSILNTIESKNPLRSPLIQSYVRFCRDAAIDPRDVNSLKKAMVVCLRSVNKQRCYEICFPGNPFIHWEFIQKHSSKNFLGDSAVWNEIMQFIVFEGLELHEKEIASKYQSFKAFREALDQSSFLLTYPDAAKLFLLNNVTGLTGRYITQLFAAKLVKRELDQKTLDLMSRLADYRFSEDAYTNALGWIMQEAIVTQAFADEVTYYFNQKEGLQMAMSQKYLQASQGRPRLRDKQKQTKNLVKNRVAMMHETVDTFDGWCSRVGFPNNTSLVYRKKAYLLAAQVHMDPADYMFELLGNKDLAEVCASCKVSRPDENKLSETLEMIVIWDEPFPELSLFRNSCFRGIAVKHSSELTLQRIVQLYFCAYQNPDLWKECWKAVFPVLSYQIIKDVEEFVQKNPFNARAFVQLLKNC